jgi:UDP-N-acetylmuramate dehydrogenase
MTLDESIRNIANCELFNQVDLSSYTTFKLRSSGNLIKIRSIEALQVLLPLLNKERAKYLVLGWGANQILPEQCEGYVIKLEFNLDKNYLDEVRDEYSLPASIGLNQLTAHAVRFGLKGWEVFTGIPASLGGAIFMNAGTNLGEIGALIKKVDIVDQQGRLRTEIIGNDSFSYRQNNFIRAGEVIVGATLHHFGVDATIPDHIKNYLAYRRHSQPLTTKNCGCVFKNPNKSTPAGKLIDLLHLKGVSSGGLQVSTKHANFIENSGEATWQDFNSLVGLINFYTDNFFGIEFELEVKIPYH